MNQEMYNILMGGSATSMSEPKSGINEYGKTDYTQNITEAEAEALLDDDRFIGDPYDFYGERDGKSFANKEEAINHFVSDRRWRNLHTGGVMIDLAGSYSMSELQKRRLARIQKVYDSVGTTAIL